MAGLRERLELAARLVLPKALGGFGGISEQSETGARLLQGVLSPGSAPTARSARDFVEAYSRLPWLRAIVGKIAFSIASVDWVIGFVQQNGQPVRSRALAQSVEYETRRATRKRLKQAGEFVEILTHPALDLLANANPFLTGLGTRKVLQAHLDLVGEAFWMLEKNAAGVPFQVWPIPPHWIMRVPSTSEPTWDIRWNALNITVPAEDMICFKDEDPAQPYGRGTGISLALGDDLEIDEYAAKHIKTRFYNRAVPELLISIEDANPVEQHRLETKFKQSAQGVFKQLMPFFINRKVDVKELGDNFRELQVIQLRSWERDMCIQTFGVPPEIFGIIANSNRATIKEGQSIYARWVLVPRLELIRSVLQERLIPFFDDRLVIDYVSPVKEDTVEQMEAAKVAPWARMVDEWRAAQGEPPLDNGAGQVFLVPNALRPVRDFRELTQGAEPSTPTAPANLELEHARQVVKRLVGRGA